MIIPVHEQNIKNCCKGGHEKFLIFWYNILKNPHEAMNKKIKDIIYKACKHSDYQRLKMFVDLVKDDTTFDINVIKRSSLLLMCVRNKKSDPQENNFKIFKYLLKHKSTNIHSLDLFIQCVGEMRIEMVKYLIENNDKYERWKCNFKVRRNLNQLFKYISSWEGCRKYAKELGDNKMCDCITVAIMSIFVNNNSDNENQKLNIDLLNLLFSSGIFSQKDIVNMGESWLEVVILMGGKQLSNKENVYLYFTYLVDGADGNAVDKQTGESLIKPTKLILQLLHDYKHVGPDSCLQWLLDARVP